MVFSTVLADEYAGIAPGGTPAFAAPTPRPGNPFDPRALPIGRVREAEESGLYGDLFAPARQPSAATGGGGPFMAARRDVAADPGGGATAPGEQQQQQPHYMDVLNRGRREGTGAPKGSVFRFFDSRPSKKELAAAGRAALLDAAGRNVGNMTGFMNDPATMAAVGAGALDQQTLAFAASIVKGEKKAERRTAKDAAGFLRYLDTGERVFPGVVKPGGGKTDTYENWHNAKNGETKTVIKGSAEEAALAKKGWTKGRPHAAMTDRQADINRMRQLRAQNTPESNRQADMIEARIKWGGKVPKDVTDIIKFTSVAENSIGSLRRLIRDGERKSWRLLSPAHRARLKQQFETLKITVAELTGRGANFTPSEEKTIAVIIGGNPTSIYDKLLTGDIGYLDPAC